MTFADKRPTAIGCMRLSTEPDRDDARSVAVLHAALDAGVTLLDTADSYCWNDDDIGHNERLIARAIATWNGDRSRITVATKGGITRPGGRWESAGRAKHLVAACERSRRALGVDRIDVYQLHAPDPRTPFTTSVRALASLKREGLIRRVGLSNVTVGQIEQAGEIVDIDAVQVELSLWHDEHFLSGVAEYCTTHGLTLLAYRPLGGRRSLSRTARNATLNTIAAEQGATPFEIALAWLADLSPVIVPLPGVTRVETVHSAARATRIQFTDAQRDRLDALCPASRVLRSPAAHPTSRLSVGRIPTVAPDAEIVLVMGLPGAGKTTFAKQLESDGYHRINRDDTGGTLRDRLPAIDTAVDAGASRIVLDNTYVSRKSRAEVLNAARARAIPVRCVWLTTSIEEAQVNAVERLVQRYGTLPGDDELTALRAHDVAAFAPTVQFRYARELEPPDAAEGFACIDRRPFARVSDSAHTHRAVIVWCDGILMRSRSGARTPLNPDDVDVDPAHGAVLRDYQARGYRLLGMSWQPGIAEGTQTVEGVARVIARMNQLLEVTVEVEHCPHGAGPPRCWCRKPLPGLGVLLIHRHRLDPAACLYVGDGAQDPGFARKLGLEYRAAGTFFR